MPSPLRRIGKWLLVTILGLAGLLILLFVFLYLWTTTRVMTRTSPDGHHTATLYRIEGFDVNFSVYVDWRCVYSSPDFAGFGRDHRERIMWTKDGHHLIFEVANRRLFGYDAAARRELTPAEVEAATMIPFEELGYEGEERPHLKRRGEVLPPPRKTTSPSDG